MSTPGNVRTGPFSIAVGGVALGCTEGDAEVNIEELGRERMIDEYGQGILDLIHLGTNMRVTVRIAEETAANLAIVFPMGLASSVSIYHGGYTPGRKYSDQGALVLLTGLRDTTVQIGLCKGVVEPGSVQAIPLSSEEDRVYQVTFLGLIDTTKTEGKRVGWITAVA